MSHYLNLLVNVQRINLQIIFLIWFITARQQSLMFLHHIYISLAVQTEINSSILHCFVKLYWATCGLRVWDPSPKDTFKRQWISCKLWLIQAVRWPTMVLRHCLTFVYIAPSHTWSPLYKCGSSYRVICMLCCLPNRKWTHPRVEFHDHD